MVQDLLNGAVPEHRRMLRRTGRVPDVSRTGGAPRTLTGPLSPAGGASSTPGLRGRTHPPDTRPRSQGSQRTGAARCSTAVGPASGRPTPPRRLHSSRRLHRGLWHLPRTDDRREGGARHRAGPPSGRPARSRRGRPRRKVAMTRLPHDATALPPPVLPVLSPRQLQVVQLLARQMSSTQISTAMSISVNTVRTRV